MNFDETVLENIRENLPGKYSVYHLQGGRLKTLYMSPGMPELCGMSKEEFVTLTEGDAANAVLANDRHRVAGVLKNFMSGCPRGELTYRLVHKMRGFLWVHASARVIGRRDNSPVILCLFHGNDFGGGEQHFLVDHAGTGIYVVDRENHELLYVNEPALRHCVKKSYLDTRCYEFFYQFSHPCPWCALSKTVKGHAHVDEIYVSSLDRWYRHDIWELEWFDRKAAAFNIVDITGQKKRQQSLELDKRNLDLILGNVPGGVAIFSDRQGAIHLDYTNEGFFHTHHGTREYWEKTQSDNPVDWLLVEDRHIFEDEFQRVRSRRKNQGTATYRVIGQDGVVHWINNQFRYAYEKSGIQYFYSSFACLDDQKESELKAEQNQHLFEAAVTGNGIGVFIYDMRHRTITTMDVHAEAISKDLGFGKRIENVPASLLSLVEERSRDSFVAMYKSLDDGVPTATCDVWFKSMAGREACCKQVSYFTQFDAKGQPLRAYGTAHDVTAQRLNEQRFRKMFQDAVFSNPESLGSFRLNLTKNTCSDGQSPYALVLSLQKEGTVEGFLAANAAIIADETMKHRFLEAYSRESLLKDFHHGRTELSLEYPVVSSRGPIIWVGGHVLMARNPVNGDIEAITYALDITRRKTTESVLSRIAEMGYDHVALIDPVARTYEIQHLSWAYQGFSPKRISDFDTILREVRDGYVYPEDRKLFDEHCNIDRLLLRLFKKGADSFHYRYRDTDGTICHKQVSYCWLDDSKNRILEFQTDVTSLHTLEEKRQEIRQKTLLLEQRARTLESTLSGIPAGLAVYRHFEGRTTLLMVNDTLCELVKSPRQRVMNEDLSEQIVKYTHPDDLQATLDGITRLFSAENQAVFTYRTLQDSGVYVWIHAVGRSVSESDGSKTGYVLYTDWTEQKKDEEEFDRKIAELYSTTPNALRVCRLDLSKNIFIQGQSRIPEENFIMAAHSADDYFAFCGSTVGNEKQRVHCLQIANRMNLLEQFQNGHTSLFFDFKRFDAAHDEVRWATSYYTMAKNPRSGNIEAVIYTLDTHDAVISSEIMARITSVDYEYVALLNVKKRTIRFLEMREDAKTTTPSRTSNYDEDINYAFGKFYGEEDKKKHVQAICFSRLLEELSHSDYYVYSFILMDEHGLPLRKQLKYGWLDNSQDTILLTRTDISAAYRQELEQMHRLTDALEEAKRANDSKTEFLSRISHDIRTPIGIIANMVEFAREDSANREKWTGDLDRIETANNLLLSLVNDVLDISKIDSGKITLNPAPYSYTDYVKTIRLVLEPLCQRKGLQFEIISNGTNENTICVDRVRLNQITLNLLSNAVKYTPVGGRITFLSENRLLENGDIEATFTVRDTGIGMSDAFQKVMFEPFLQEYENPYRPKNTTGTGLGLAIVKRLIDLIGGSIAVHSVVGKGTEISVSLVAPRQKDTCDDVQGTVPKQAVRLIQLSGCVLVVEDNPVNAEIASRMLETIGLTVEKVENGLDALHRFESSEPGRFRAIFMDIQMPIMNGYEATERIRASSHPDARTVPIIAMTADAYTEAMERCRKAGMTQFLTKPFDINKISRLLAPHSRKML